MSVVSIKELPRSMVLELNRPAQLTRRWVLVLADNILESPLSETWLESSGFIIPRRVGNTSSYATHPSFPYYVLRKITYAEGYEGSPYHALVTGEYGPVTQDEMTSPTARSAHWEFSTAPGEVPAMYYYSGEGNGQQYPLVNSAYDYFAGLVTQESTIVARITQNFTTRPDNWISSQNFVNSDTYLGGVPHSWKVQSVSVQLASEDFNNQLVSFWRATAELHYRQSTHNYLLPDVGFNFLDGGQKRRCMVFDFQNAEWIPSPNPVGLNGSGSQTLGAPAILNRRVNPETNFTALFGTPPVNPPALQVGA